jgi:hypothetical protein
MIILRGGKASSFDGNHIQNHHRFSDDLELWSNKN